MANPDSHILGFSGGCQVQKREHVLWLDVGNAAQVPDGEGEDVEVGGEGDLDRKARLSTSVRRTYGEEGQRGELVHKPASKKSSG